MGKRFQTTKDMTSQGLLIPAGTVGEFASGDDSQISPGYLQGQSTSADPSALILKFLITGGATKNVAISMEQLGKYVEDVPIDTPLTTISILP